MAKLKPNMTELASEPKLVEGLPEGFKEGPFAFERNGKYYFTFPWVRERMEPKQRWLMPWLTIRWDLSHSRASSWMSRLRSAGPIIIASWNIRDSGISSIIIMIIRLSLTRTVRVRIDSLNFNPDGTIQKVIPTLRGVDWRTLVRVFRLTAILRCKARVLVLNIWIKQLFCRMEDSLF